MGLEQGEKNYNVEQHEKVKVEKPEVSMYPDSDRRTVMDLPFSDKIRPMTEKVLKTMKNLNGVKVIWI